MPFVLLLALPNAHAGEQAKPNLCESGEKVVFSCSVSKKVASLCSTPEISSTSGRLTYRFGVPGQTPELSYPTAQLSPSAAFATEFYDWPKGSFSAVQFKRGDFVYTVYNRMAVYEEHNRSNGGGVKVQRQGKQIADLWCDNNSIYDNIWESLNKIGLPKIETH